MPFLLGLPLHVALLILFRSNDDTLRLDFIAVQTAVKLSNMVQCSTSSTNSQGSSSSLVISLSSSCDGSKYVWSCVILSSGGTKMSKKAQGWLSDSRSQRRVSTAAVPNIRWWGCIGLNVLRELPLPSLTPPHCQVGDWNYCQFFGSGSVSLFSAC